MSTTTTAPEQKRRLPSFGVQILLGLVLGVALGWLALALGPAGNGDDNGLTVALSTIGSSFVTLLKAVVPPLVLTAIIASIANLRGVANGARLAGQTLLWFAITALVAVGIGIGLGLAFQPGAHTGVTKAAAAAPAKTGTWLDFLHGTVPTNFLGLQASSSLAHAGDAVVGVTTGLSFNVLQLIVVAIVLGLAALKVGAKAEPFLTLNASVLSVVQTVLWWIIRLAPIGTIGLVGRAIATYGWDSLASLAVFAAAIYVGLALVLFVVYPVLLRSHGLRPSRYFRGAWPAIQLGFVSRSSIGTLPVTERVTHRNLGVPRAYASFAVPLGATTKMDGCAAIYPAVAAIFVAQFFGLDLGVTDYLLIAFVSVVGSAATAGLTGAIVMLTLTLSTLGLPLEGVGLLLAVDPILDMGRTAVNVAGQALVPVIVAKREGILDVEQYNSANAENLFTDDEPAVEATPASPSPAERQPVGASA
ncbi:sodium:proton antiporter [Intrasporangium chromatireducens Q5-1]|uniref:Sodium:proton antiporter n=1 Tax=Intrasporangium chromatireducens Q5-1 TaxID=584657 RepID=W9GLG0_9MICO|nr:dicarboxylate/amino acid:cation symporter [Intrasporangium chromatireducens]EWT04734.1 sodium:proton antiporter [Intrasporangium chromatireducens Q5-1]